MLGPLNQVAIAVPDVREAAKLWQDRFDADVSEPQAEPDHGVTVVFVNLPNTKIELLEPLGENSPIEGFLKKNPKGGIHHIGFEVDELIPLRDRLRDKGVTITGTGEPRIGAHGNPVIFLHPKDCNGALIELEEVKG
jgi:methylmalonyl-CoA/ethylmalonyl-CoA epimerase